MKTLVYTVLIASLLACSGKEQSQNSLPDSVEKGFKALYPEASIVKWEEKNTHYDIDFVMDGLEYEAEITSNGELKELEREVLIEDLPIGISDHIRTNYPTYKIEEAEWMQIGGNIFYEVEIENESSGEDDEMELVFSQTGVFLGTEKEVFN